MLLLIAFACFFAMFAVWMIVPNIEESKRVKSVPMDAPAEQPADSTAMPARA